MPFSLSSSMMTIYVKQYCLSSHVVHYPICQKYNIHVTAVNTDTATKSHLVWGHFSYIKQKKVFPQCMKKNPPQKAKQHANITTQWDKKEWPELNFPIAQCGHEWQLCFACSILQKKRMQYLGHKNINKTMHLHIKNSIDWIKDITKIK